MNELEGRIRDSLHARAQDLEPTPALWRQVETRRSRLQRRVWFQAVAVVAVVAAAVAVPLVVAGLRHQPPDVLIDPTPTETATGQPSPSESATFDEKPAATESPPVEERPSFARVESVLRSWLQAIQDGDEDRAWDLMTPEAQAGVGRDRFDEMMASALPEGLGSFADASDFHYVVVSSQGDDARLAAVVSGRVTREGTTEFAAMAIPMRVHAGQTLVDDPIVDRSRYYDRQAVFASASLGPQQYHAGDELSVEFTRPEGATAVLIAMDDNERPLPTRFDRQSGQATATLDRDLEAGRHITTIVVLHQSGRLYPEAIIFEAAAP